MMILTARLIAFSCLISSLEFLSLKKYFTEHSIWRWSEIKKEHPLLPYLDFILADHRFNLFLGWRLFASLGLFFFPHSFALSFFLFISSILLSLRFRGSFNGGSDYMSMVILSALCVANSADHLVLKKAALLYIALILCTSYFIAGIVKIKQREWRQGVALTQFLSSPNYRPPLLFVKMMQNKRLGFGASWAIMLFELLFPLVFLLKAQAVMVVIALAFSFHLINTLLFGLNRFLWVWAATYPALYISVTYLASSSSR